MSTKCTVLCDHNEMKKDAPWYHFYYNQMDEQYHIDFKNGGEQLFLNKVGELLEQCPLSDSGIWCINLTGGKSTKKYYPKTCKKLNELRKKLRRGLK